MLILHLECFCVHQQQIVLQKDLFQLAEICIWYNKTFFIVAPWCQITEYDPTFVPLKKNIIGITILTKNRYLLKLNTTIQNINIYCQIYYIKLTFEKLMILTKIIYNISIK
jgi:hypothetical protein